MPARAWGMGLGGGVLLFAFILFAAVPAYAADDSNAGQLTPTPTLNSQQLGTVLTSLGQGSNDSQLQSLLSQFQSQMDAGNYSGAAPTLGKLQDLSSSNQSGSSQSLNALLQSISVGNNGASVNSSKLASLLNSSPSSATSVQSQQKLSADLQSLASLLQYANSTLASQLLQNSSLLSKAGFGNTPVSIGGAPVSLPGVSGLAGLGVPSVGAPSLSIGTPSASLPTVSLAAFLVPLLVGGVVVALFFSRGKLVRLVGSQSLPGMPIFRRSKDEPETWPVPSDPRGRIEYYFARAVRLMARRGVPKAESETHREFFSNCASTPEVSHVGTISSLYEKAKFSGQGVATIEADLAASELRAMDAEER